MNPLGCAGKETFATEGHAFYRALALHGQWASEKCHECGFWHVVQIPSSDPHMNCVRHRPCSTGCTA